MPHDWSFTGRYSNVRDGVREMFSRPISVCANCKIEIPYPRNPPPEDLKVPGYGKRSSLDNGYTCEELRGMDLYGNGPGKGRS